MSSTEVLVIKGKKKRWHVTVGNAVSSLWFLTLQVHRNDLHHWKPFLVCESIRMIFSVCFEIAATHTSFVVHRSLSKSTKSKSRGLSLSTSSGPPSCSLLGFLCCVAGQSVGSHALISCLQFLVVAATPGRTQSGVNWQRFDRGIWVMFDSGYNISILYNLNYIIWMIVKYINL
jgi:hypothetical protein